MRYIPYQNNTQSSSIVDISAIDPVSDIMYLLTVSLLPRKSETFILQGIY